MSHLTIRELPPQRFDQAFLLARAIEPCLTPAGWRHYLEALRRQEQGGLLAVENERGVLLAFAAYRPRETLSGGPCLECDPVAVFELVGGGPVARALAGALERRAEELHCQSLHIHLLGGLDRLAETPLLRSFRERGHRIEATRLCKRLPPPLRESLAR